MTKETLLRLFAVLLAVAGGEVEVTEETETVECTEQSIGATTYKQECSIYMAPSSLHGIVGDGLGVYTTKAMTKGDKLLSSQHADGPSIPVVDYNNNNRRNNKWHHHHDEDDGLDLDRKQWVQLFNGYWWDRGVPDHTRNEAEQVADFQITFGSLPNHHCILSVLDFTFEAPSYDDTMMMLDSYSNSSSISPGAGAISYHNGRNFFVKKNLTAGSEIFLNYGHCERGNNGPEWTENIPIKEDFVEAASITLHIWDSLEGDLLDTTKINRMIAHYKDELNNNNNNSNNTIAIASLVPSTASQFIKVIEDLRRWDSDELIKRIATLIGTTPRSPEWIRDHGLCIENLIPGKSQIPQAGRGAIAQFAMKRGEIIVPVPTLQIINKDVLIMIDEESGEKVGTQLLINYCFGHAASSLLLCPNTNAILVNHCSSQKPDPACKDGPNAKVKWASAWDKASPQWLEMTMEELAKQEGRGISMEIVALRDIEPGEEVFIDYGQEWEIAWETHVQNWKPPQRHGMYMSATEANADPEEALKRFLSNDLRKIVEHTNLWTGCVYFDHTLDSSDITTDGDPDWWMKLSDGELLGTYSTDGSGYLSQYNTHYEDSHWDCQVIAPDAGGQTYTVRILMHNKYAPIFLTNFPRESIHFFHNLYGSDQHLPGAFRHHIGIPEEMMPVHWKNRLDNNEEPTTLSE